MQVRDKLKVFFFLLLFNIIIPVANADNLSDAISAYKSEEYKEALTLLKEEIKLNPQNPELYKWLAKTYEAMFDVEESLEAYKTYEKLRRTQDASSLLSPSPMILSPTPLITFTPLPLPSPSIKPTSTPLPTPRPTIRPTPRPTPVPTPKATLSPIYTGWTDVKIMNYSLKNEIKLIRANSADMSETIEKSEKGKSFLLIETSIKYAKNIIIKSNSDQIKVTDMKNNSYFLYAMNTYKFEYNGNNASERIDVIQVSDYYELSKKDSRSKIKLLFKVNNNSAIKDLSIKGYGNLEIK